MAAKWNQISSANSCCTCQGEILFSQTNKCKSCGKLSSWNSNQTRFECGHFCSNAKGKHIHPWIVINFVNNCIVKWRLGAWDILELPLFILVTRRPYCHERPKELCFTTLNLAMETMGMRLSVVKWSFFGPSGQHGRLVTRANLQPAPRWRLHW